MAKKISKDKWNIVLIGIVITVSVLIILSVSGSSAQQYTGCGMYNSPYGFYGSGLMSLGWIVYIVFIGLMIGLIYLILNSGDRKNR